MAAHRRLELIGERSAEIDLLDGNVELCISGCEMAATVLLSRAEARAVALHLIAASQELLEANGAAA